MGRIGEYTQQIFLDRANPSNIDASGGVYMNKARQAQLDSQMYQERGAAAVRWGNEVQRQRDIQGELNARERFNQFQRTKIEWQQAQQNERMTSPDGFAKEFDDWHRMNANEIEDVALSGGSQPFDRSLFRQLMDNDRTSTFGDNTNWENGMRVRNITTGLEKNLDDMNVNYSLTNPTIKDLPAQLRKQREYVATTGANILSPDEQNKIFGYASDKAALSTMNSELENDPKKLRNILLYGGASQDQLIDFVFDIEGQDRVAQEPDGAVAKYGINSKHNGLTNDQVIKLTPDEARLILKKKYWDPRLDKMDPAFRAVAFDALVNHGNDKDTWSIIQAAKGDPYALISLRQEKYASLISSNPAKYAQYKNGWDARMQEMAEYVRAQEDGGQEFLRYAGLVNPDIITRTQAEIPAAIATKIRKDDAEKKQRVAEFNVAYKDAYDTMINDLEPIGQEEINKIQQLAVNSGDVDSKAKADTLMNTMTYVNNLKGLSDEQLRQVIRKTSADVNKIPTPANRLALSIAEGVLKNQQAAVKEEGIAYWGRIGQIRMPQAINYGDPASAMDEMALRQQSAEIIYKKTGKMLPLLTPAETSSLNDKINSIPADEAAGILSSFDGLDKQSKSILAKAIDEKSPVLAVAISVDNIDTRRRILVGSKIDPKYKKEEMAANISEILDPMVVDEDFKQGAIKAVSAWYRAKAQEERDFSEEITTSRIKEGIYSIYGPIVDLSLFGTDNVFSFKDQSGEFVSEDEMYNMFHGLNDDQLKKILGGLPKGAKGEFVTAEDIKENGTIISAGDGLYNVIFKNVGDMGEDMYAGLYDKKGNLVEIDGRELLDIYRKDAKKQRSNLTEEGLH